MMLKFALAPFSFLYGIAIYTRNWLFDLGILKSQSFSTPTICVGNLNLGGTGKTPHTEYLIRLLKDDFRIATLSRGYKRKTKGFVMASSSCNALDIGDEPMQIHTKFPGIAVTVDEKRVRGIQNLLQIQPNIDAILLDDAFQHRHLKPGLSILLTDYHNPVYNDYLLPMGTLRDSIRQKRRANIIIVTKCPTILPKAEQEGIRKKIKPSKSQSIYFTSLRYGDLKPVFEGTNINLDHSKKTKLMAIAGIAKPKLFFEHLDREHIVCERIQFPDHYHFTEKKIKAIFEQFSELDDKPEIIVTTEKDAARLIQFRNLPHELKRLFYYIPIEVEFLNNQTNDFNNKLNEYVRKSSRNNGLHSKQGNR